MRVSVLGKGGSGKTTVALTLVKYLEKYTNKQVVAIDADVNTHMAKSLDMDIKYLGDEIEQLGYYFEGNRGMSPLVVIGTTPPDYNSTFIYPDLNDPFFNKFATKKDDLRLLTIGSYTDSNIGSDCYHSKLGSAELILNRMLDDDSMAVVVDATAGVDSVGTSMFFVSDINLFVVEPTIKSIEVYRDFENLTKDMGIKTYVVLNKVESSEDLEFVKEYIDEEKILGSINKSNDIKRVEQGKKEYFDKFVEENKEVFEKIYTQMFSLKRDWDRYKSVMNNIYLKNCNSWYNDYYGINLSTYINPQFSYKKVIEDNR